MNFQFSLFLIFIVCVICVGGYFSFQEVFALTVTHNYNNGSATGWNGKIYVEKFTGLPASERINQLSLNVSTVAGHVRAKIYNDDGFVASHSVTHNNIASTSTSGGGNSLWIQKYAGLPIGAKITGVQFQTATSGNAQVKIFDNNGTYVHETSSTQCPLSHGFSCGGSGNFKNAAVMFLTKLTGLSANKTITGLTLESGSGSTFGTTRFYADDAGSHGGTSGFPYTFLGGSNGGGNGFTSKLIGKIPSDGVVWAGIQWNGTTGVLYNSGDTGKGVDCSATIGNATGPDHVSCGDVSEWVGYTIYWNDQNSTGMPLHLLAESTSTSVTTSPQTVSFNSPAIVPSSGIIWAGWNLSGPSNIATKYSSSGTPTMNLQYSQTEGTSGPSTFGPWFSGTNNTSVVVYQAIQYSQSSGPSTLLSESNSILVNSTGQQNFPLNATIPASRNVWGAFETDNAGLGLRELTNALTGIIYKFTHTYGTGPNPISGDSNSTTPAWLQLTYGTTLTLSPTSGSYTKLITVNGTGYGANKTITFKYDSNALATSPSTVTSNGRGEFSGVTFTVPNTTIGLHIITATDGTRNGTANFNTYLNIQVGNVTGGQFTQTYKTSEGT